MKKMIVSAILLLVIFNYSKTQENEPENITCKQTFELIQKHSNDTDFVILDLRPESMYNEEHIKNAIYYDVFSPDFENWADKQDRNKTYLLYCNIGNRSGIALKKMKEMGFKNLYHMYEGIREWKNQGYETVTREK